MHNKNSFNWKNGFIKEKKPLFRHRRSELSEKHKAEKEDVNQKRNEEGKEIK